MRSGLVFGLLVATLPACVTPMSRNDVESLTTCRNTDLKKIRKALLLSGYEIKSETETDLVTDFRQVSGHPGYRVFRRITVVKTGDDDFVFRVRVKNERLVKGDGAEVGFSSRTARRGGAVVVDLSRPVLVESEEDQEYYEEHRSEHVLVQHEVCGS